MRGGPRLPRGTPSNARYPIPPRLFLAEVWSILRDKRRSLSQDVASALSIVRPRPQVCHAHHIPADGPFAVVMNHYCREGLDVWWSAALVTWAIYQQRPGGEEVRWVMTSEWFFQNPLRRWFQTPLTRWFFNGIANMYGFITMPPMVAGSGRVGERAQAVRRTLAEVARRGGVIALAPEGGDVDHMGLTRTPPGVGRFMLLLCRAGLPLLPAGLAEREGRLEVSFGPPFFLEVEPGLSKEERDRQASEQVMVAIGRLLPQELWGEYAQEIARAVDDGPCSLSLS
ncbi:MAG: lysophospholipid acyltransferase family protein [Anaerolineae bacterium]